MLPTYSKLPTGFLGRLTAHVHKAGPVGGPVIDCSISGHRGRHQRDSMHVYVHATNRQRIYPPRLAQNLPGAPLSPPPPLPRRFPSSRPYLLLTQTSCGIRALHRSAARPGRGGRRQHRQQQLQPSAWLLIARTVDDDTPPSNESRRRTACRRRKALASGLAVGRDWPARPSRS